MVSQFKRWIALTLSAILMSSLPLFSSFSGLIARAATPTITTANISIVSEGTGFGGAFKIGDTLTGQFDDSGNLPADQATSVSIDFSQFGGGIVAASETAPSSHIWQASYAVVNGSVDSASADISVSATNTDGTSTLEDDEDHTVDNIRPVINGTGTIVIVKNNSGSSTRAAIGDQISFSVGSLVDTTADGTTYTANLSSATGNAADATLATGSTSNPIAEGTLNGSGIKFPVTATDNAGNNQSTTEWTGTKTFDTIRPTLASANTASVTRVAVNFSEAIASGSVLAGNFSITNPTRPVSAVALDGTTRVNVDTTSALSPNATPSVTVSGLYDTAGNTILPLSTIVAADGIKPQVGPDVEDVAFTEGQNDRDETITVRFSENIAANGSPSDYAVLYDADGNFSTAGDQRSVTVNSVSNPQNDRSVELAIADQSANLDFGGKFQVTADTSGNIQDAASNAVDPFANAGTSASVSVFDSSIPTLTGAGLEPSTGLYGVGYGIWVYVETGDSDSDRSLGTLSGSINGQALLFTYDGADNRYEANYTVTEGQSDLAGLEAYNIQLQDRAGNSSNLIDTSGNSLSVDANTPAAPVVTDPSSERITNASAYTFWGTAEEGSTVKIYTDPNNDSDKSDGAVVGSTTVSGGSFSVVAPLAQNADNNFVVTSTDAAGNESGATDVPTVEEDSDSPTVAVNFPNGGEIFADNSSTIITWTPATDTNLKSTPISLYYSEDNGANYTLIATDEANDGAYSWTTPNINSGQVLVRVAAEDEAGNVGQDISDGNFAIDNSEPGSQVSADLQGQVYGPENWESAPINGQISGTASDSPAGVASVALTIIDPNGLYWNGGGWAGAPATVTATGTSSWSYAFDKANLVVNSGTYAIASRATDNAGHTESTGTGSFVWDNQDPTASIINPNSSTKWRQGNRNITWSASDSHFGAQPIKLEYQLDGGEWNLITSATENDGSYSWDIPDGTNSNEAKVRLIATDGALNSIVIESDLFTIDSTAPSVSLDSPSDGSLERGTVTLTASAEDSAPPTSPSGMNYVRFAYRLSGTSSWTNLPTVSSSPYNYDWDTTTVADGAYQVRATAYDNAGNSRATSSPYTSLTIDNTPPDVDAGSDKIANSQVSQDATVTGADSYLWTQASGPGTLTFGSPNSVDTTISADQDGVYTARLTATDLAGNSANDEMTLTWDTTAPTVVLTDDQADNLVRDADTVNITATFTEADQIDETTVPEITIGDAVTNAQMTRSSNLVWTYAWDVPLGHDHDEAVSVSATDRANNPNATATGRTSYTIDNSAPIITVLGDNPTTVEVGSSYTDAGATALDAREGDLTESITTVNSVNPNVLGSYTVTYDISDSLGNAADQAVRTVNVVDTRPIISGENPTTINETSATITWATDHPSTSRVVYDIVPHADISGWAPGSNYGYINSTIEDPTLVTSHSAVVSGLTAGTTYYFRTVSHGSPESISSERSFTTSAKDQSVSVVTVSTTSSPSAGSAPEEADSEAQEIRRSPAPAASIAPSETPAPEIKGETTQQNKQNYWLWILLAVLLAATLTASYLYYQKNSD